MTTKNTKSYTQAQLNAAVKAAVAAAIATTTPVKAAKVKSQNTPAPDAKRTADTVKLLAWAKATNHPRLAIKAEYAISKGGYLNKSAFEWATEQGFKL